MADEADANIAQPGGYIPPQNQQYPAPGNSTFNLNDPQQRQQALQWLAQAQSGQTQQLPHDQMHHAYRQWSQQAPPQQVADATSHAMQQMPQDQQQSFAQQVTGWLGQHGITPQQAGVQQTNPQQMSPQDVGKMVGHAQQQNPDALHQLFSPNGLLGNKAVQLGLAGVLAYAASKTMGGK